MRSRVGIIIIALSVMGTVFSCAKRESEDSRAIEQRSLDAWVAKYYPDALPLGDYGIYYEVLEAAPEGAEQINLGQWAFANYKIRDIAGNLIYSRDADEARRQGEYTIYTRYIPDYFPLPEEIEEETYMKGMYYGLADMKVGERRRFFIPSQYGYVESTFQNTFGYGGQYALNSNAPLILDDIVVTELVPDPVERERELVRKLVTEQWGMSEADSVKAHLYMQVLNPEGRDERDTIAIDGIAEFYFAGFYVEDGELFDTNVEEAWIEAFGELRKYDPVKPIQITRKEDMSSLTSMPDLTFAHIISEVRFGDTVRVASVSEYAYQDQGKPGYRTTSLATEEDNSYYSALMSSYLYSSSMYGSSSGSYDYWYMMQYLMSSSSESNQVTEPVPEVKLYTPVMFTFIVQKPEVEEEEES